MASTKLLLLSVLITLLASGIALPKLKNKFYLSNRLSDARLSDGAGKGEKIGFIWAVDKGSCYFWQYLLCLNRFVLSVNVRL